MDPLRFLTDIELRPATYRSLAQSLESDSLGVRRPTGHVLLLGMGSSRYAAATATRYLQRAGVHAVTDYASAELGPEPGPDVTVLAISAGGGSVETAAVLERHVGRSHIVAITNRPDSDFAQSCDSVVELQAEEESGGVACRSFSHTLAVLLHLASEWGEADLGVPIALRRAADAVEDLLTRRTSWLEPICDALAGPSGTWLLAPAERLASADQGALMLREGPRRLADACETGDWSHVDVYLTKTLDYRAMIFAGSRWDSQALEWMRQRGSTFVGVGADLGGAVHDVRYPGDDDAFVALLTEIVVPELVAQRWWVEGSRG